jgi:AraC family transcriptional regulator
MSGPVPSVNRFFVHQQYSIFFRDTKKFHWQDDVRSDYAVLFLLDGELSYQAGEDSGTIGQNQFLLFEPSTAARASSNNAQIVLVNLSPSFLLDFVLRMRLAGPGSNITFPQRVIRKDQRLTDLGKSLATELASDNAGQEIVLAATVEHLAVHLLRNFSNMRRSDELELSRVGLIDRRIRRAVELMHAQMDRELSLKEIAAASYLSPFHFARLFKKLTGSSPHAYLATLRTKRAQLLLAETDLSVTEISSRVGYASSSHFTKAFRQATGLTPRGFRTALISRNNLR